MVEKMFAKVFQTFPFNFINSTNNQQTKVSEKFIIHGGHKFGAKIEI